VVKKLASRARRASTRGDELPRVELVRVRNLGSGCFAVPSPCVPCNRNVGRWLASDGGGAIHGKCLKGITCFGPIPRVREGNVERQRLGWGIHTAAFA
jgi:hypothetical protein